MGTIDDIKRMQGEGKSDFEIRETLRARGLSSREIDDAVSQAKIKDAVASGSDGSGMYSNSYEATPGQENNMPQQGFEGMQPSLVAEEVSPELAPQSEYSYSQPEADYSQYQNYQNSMSSDVITEIAEQIVDDRLSYLKEKVDKALEFRTIADARISSIDERLKRIEKIIDTLQMSVLQKVAGYVNDVSDIKKEMQETQKSLKAIHNKHSSKEHHTHHK